MKKKASFLISGITTVALLATAVGSFAAWNSLSANAEGFQVESASRVEVKVAKDDAFVADNKVLLPKNALTSEATALYGADAAADEVAIGAFDLTKTDADSISEIKATTEVKNGADEVNNIVIKYYLKTGENVATTETNADNLTTGKYVVKASFANADASVDDADKALAGKSLTVKVTCTAVKKTTV